MEALERFKYPAKYIKESKGNACLEAVSDKVLSYKLDNGFATMTGSRWDLHIVNHGEISKSSLEKILEYNSLLEKELMYHPLKRAILNMDDNCPNDITIEYDDINDALIFKYKDEWIKDLTLYSDGRFEKHKNYNYNKDTTKIFCIKIYKALLND